MSKDKFYKIHPENSEEIFSAIKTPQEHFVRNFCKQTNKYKFALGISRNLTYTQIKEEEYNKIHESLNIKGNSLTKNLLN